uniref:inositol 1,4,5-trisphosphate receptor-interacting protein n=1 Tax=Scatophagus argus TaxID=75038 RepID=UPI001ED85C84|nr:inositol 1,4,5-trisphosphate receptor-interacting protein [Scatophagus argus]
MQDTLLRVFVVALGLLTYPKDDPRVEERGDITTVSMQKYEERLLKESDKRDLKMAPVDEEVIQQNQSVLEDATVSKQDSEEHSTDGKLPEGRHFMTASDLSLPQSSKTEPETVFDSKEQGSHLQIKTSEKETSEKAIVDWERDYLWYIWNTFSIISMIRLFKKFLGGTTHVKHEETRPFPVTYKANELPLPDSDTLRRFHSKCVKASSEKKWKDDEFLEGFAGDLLDAMKTVCDRNGGMVMEDFEMVDICDIIVPFSPSDPYSFQCLLWNNQASDLLPDMQVCGQIKLVENKVQNGCSCQSPNADDMVCLLHCETEKAQVKITDACDGLLCMKNSPYLSKSQVTRWFQSTIKQAWALISHKYEFALNIPYIDAPGALVVRFRSGRKITFTMNPVVKFNTDAYFFITSCSSNNLDTFWTLSLTKYEDHFLEHMSKHLPENTCHNQTLEIAQFLLKRQSAFSGSSALKDFHFKTAIMHLLLTKDSSQWKPSYVACRLRDLLDFMEKSLEKKLLHHVLIGNPLTQKVIELPAEFTQAKTVNLFHPLVVHNCIYRDAIMHFQEMLKNAHMLIHDYVDRCNDSTKCFI